MDKGTIVVYDTIYPVNRAGSWKFMYDCFVRSIARRWIDYITAHCICPGICPEYYTLRADQVYEDIKIIGVDVCKNREDDK